MKALSFPFRVRGGVQTTTNYDQIVRGQVIDAVVTNAGERLMNPEWGCNLRAHVFDNAEALDRSDAANVMAQKLPLFVPRAQITRADLDQDQENPSLVRINIGYQASAYSSEATLSLPLNTSGSDITGSETA